jgi:hypothetical protein
VNFTAKIAEFWHLLKARLALLAGRRGRARMALKAAVRRNPSSFMAHFMLGRVYWRDRAVVKAKREFDLAWQIDPERFERAYARLQTQHEGVPELFSYPAGVGEVPVSVRRPASGADDFRSESERRRLRDLPPITRDEILRIDWDRFEEEILRDSESL